MSRFDDLLKSKSVSQNPPPLQVSPPQQLQQPRLVASPQISSRQGKPGISIRARMVKMLAGMAVLLGLSLVGNLLLHRRAQDFEHQIKALRHDEIRRQDFDALKAQIESVRSTVEHLVPAANRLSGELGQFDHDLRDFLNKVQRIEASGGKNGTKAEAAKGEGGTEPAH